MQKREAESWMREEYEKRVAADLDWKLRTLAGPTGPRAVVDGKRSIVLCSNNYLNLSNHPKVKEAGKRAMDTHGAGSGSVRPIAGNMDLHEELERRIARFKHRQAALYYMSGFAGNAGLIPQLAGEGDALLTDELNHGSIIDGVRLTKAQRFIYKHNDVADLERTLKEADPKFKKLLIIGDGGRGVASHFHVEDKIHVELGTFSKALGVVGGYVAGSNDLRNYALNKSRTWLLSGTPTPSTTAPCIAAIDVLETEPQHVERLWENTRYFKKELVSLGFDIGRSETPITPVMCGDPAIARKLSQRLFELGVFALPIVFPMVAKDKARIRTIMNAGLSSEDLDEALAAFEKAGKEVGLLT